MNPLEIRTPRLVLVLMNPDQVLAWLDAQPPEIRAEVSDVWIERVRRTQPGDFWSLSFEIRMPDGKAIGGCAFKGPPDDEGVVELGYAIDEDRQCQGYATEAVTALARFAFETGGVSRVKAHTKPENVASRRVLTKCGFERIGMVEEPEDGLVERWEKQRERSS